METKLVMKESEDIQIIKKSGGWVLKNHEKTYGPLVYLPRDKVDKSNLAEIYNALGLETEMQQRKLNRALLGLRLTVSSESYPEPEEFEACPEEFFKDGRFIPKLLGDEVNNHYFFKTMVDSKEIYVYKNGIYIDEGTSIIEKACNQLLGDEYRKSRLSEVVDYIRTGSYAERKEEPLNLMLLQNGVLNLKSMILEEYNPNLMFFQKLPVKYDSSAECPLIDKFLSEIVGLPEDIKILEEVAGYCLLRDYPIHKALMLVGDGANGKSTFLNLVKEILGKNNVASRSLYEFEKDRFAKSDLFGKLANIYPDLPDIALRHTGTFKILTGGDLVGAQKKFRNPFTFVNYAKLLFSANKVPEAYDDTDAFFRRWIILVFPNKFEGDNCDIKILDKLTTESELSGFLNHALQGLQRILENGCLSYSKTTEDIRRLHPQIQPYRSLCHGLY